MIRQATFDDVRDINRWCARDGYGADYRPFLENPMNVCLLSGEGGALFVWRGPGIYEVHVFFEQRGRDVLRLSHAMLDWMRANRSARMFWAAVPVEKRRVIMFTRLMGWRSAGEAEMPHGLCEIFHTEYC